MILRLLPVVVGLGLLAPLAGGAQTPPDPFRVLDDAGRVYRGARGTCADFVQTLSVPLLGEERVGRGRVCSRQPDRFAMRFTQPAGDLVVADGEWLWMYTPSSDAKQVLRVALAGGTRGVDFYREFLDAPADKYRARWVGRETTDGAAVHHLSLTPLAPASYRRAEVWISVQGALLRRIEIHEENGSVRTATLSSVDLAPSLGADAFRFTPPVGAQVITR